MRSLARPLTHGPLTKGVQGLGPGTCFNAAHSVRLFYLPPIISHLLLRGYCQAMSRQRAAAGVADADSVLVPTHIRDLGRAGGAQGLQVGALPCRVLSLLGRRPAAHVRVPPVGCSRAIARRCLCHANAQISHPVTLLFGDVPGKAVDVQSGRPASIFHVQLRLCVLHARCKPRVIYIYICPFRPSCRKPYSRHNNRYIQGRVQRSPRTLASPLHGWQASRDTKRYPQTWAKGRVGIALAGSLACRLTTDTGLPLLLIKRSG